MQVAELCSCQEGEQEFNPHAPPPNSLLFGWPRSLAWRLAPRPVGAGRKTLQPSPPLGNEQGACPARPRLQPVGPSGRPGGEAPGHSGGVKKLPGMAAAFSLPAGALHSRAKDEGGRAGRRGRAAKWVSLSRPVFHNRGEAPGAFCPG